MVYIFFGSGRRSCSQSFLAAELFSLKAAMARLFLDLGFQSSLGFSCLWALLSKLGLVWVI